MCCTPPLQPTLPQPRPCDPSCPSGCFNYCGVYFPVPPAQGATPPSPRAPAAARPASRRSSQVRLILAPGAVNVRRGPHAPRPPPAPPRHSTCYSTCYTDKAHTCRGASHSPFRCARVAACAVALRRDSWLVQILARPGNPRAHVRRTENERVMILNRSLGNEGICIEFYPPYYGR